MKFGDLLLVHVGLPVDSTLVAELLSERQIIIQEKQRALRLLGTDNLPLFTLQLISKAITERVSRSDCEVGKKDETLV